jgi:Uma2 family endonuclease
MTVSETASSISASAYLKGEQDGQARHEYLAGRVYAMTGGSVYHNRIGLAFAAVLREKLRGRPCDVFMADMKVQTRQAFYYPDIMVVCDATDCDPYTKTRPQLIAEIVSPNTRSIDEREKRAAYLELDSLREYLLVEQDRPELRVIQRDPHGGWRETLCGPDDLIRLPSLGLDIAMQHLYEGAWR